MRVVRTLHCAITRSGLETMNIGAPMMGARREAKSLVAPTEEMLRTPTRERTERLSSRPAAALHIFRPRGLLAPLRRDSTYSTYFKNHCGNASRCWRHLLAVSLA